MAKFLGKKLYYLKWDVENKIIILDQRKRRVSNKEVLIVPYKITESQASTLKVRLTLKFFNRNRNPFVNDIEYEFYKLFHVCNACGHVTNKSEVNKAWGNLCKSCFRKLQVEKVKENQANKDYKKRIRELKEYMKTKQGAIDAVPVDVIASNIRISAIKRGKTMREIANHLGMTDSKFSSLLVSKRIDADILQAVCEFLMTPMERMLRLPRGFKVKKKDGVPAFWLDDGFRIKKKDNAEE